MKKLLLLLTTILLVSCSPQKRLAKLLKDHPELVKSDTIKVRDTVIVPAIHTDTILQNTITRDTVVITKDKLVIKYFNNGKTVYLGGEVKKDTIIKEIPVIVNTVTPPVKYIPDFYLFSTWGLYILLLLEMVLLWIYLKINSK